MTKKIHQTHFQVPEMPWKKDETEGEMGYLKNTAFQQFLDLRYTLLALAGNSYNCLRAATKLVSRLPWTGIEARAKEAREKALKK